jgi:hypothetical protein
MSRAPTALVATLALMFLAACSSEESGPYIAIDGGGFIFNYRIAEATEGLVVGVRRELPEGAKIEVTFEDPAGGAPIVLAEAVKPKLPRYDFTTPPLTGIVKDKDYRATVRLLDASGEEIEKVERTFRSELDQSILPAKPLTIGPGYARNPDAESKPAETP